MALELKPSKDEQNQTKLTEPPLAIKEGATESLESPIWAAQAIFTTSLVNAYDLAGKPCLEFYHIKLGNVE